MIDRFLSVFISKRTQKSAITGKGAKRGLGTEYASGVNYLKASMIIYPLNMLCMFYASFNN
jgi:hypothetical protein